MATLGFREAGFKVPSEIENSLLGGGDDDGEEDGRCFLVE